MHNKFPKYYYFIDKFNKDDIKKLDKNIAVIYRNYSKKINIKELIVFNKFLKKKKIKFFLANNVKLSIKLNLDGVYIPAFNKKISINCFSRKKNFKVIGSAHNLHDIKIKEKQGIKVLFISPLFKTFKSLNYLDTIKFNLLTSQTDLKLVALGGINQFNFKKLFLLNIYGFASISFFKKTDKMQLRRIIIKHKNCINNHSKIVNE